MSDLISREYMKSLGGACITSRSKDGTLFPIVSIDELPPADQTHPTPSNTLGVLDCVERQAAIDEIDEWIIAFWVNGHKESAADARLIQDGIIQLPSVQPERMVLPEICILEGYDTVEDENGNRGFGVYIPSKKQIYVAGDVPREIMLKALFHELTHWVQDISGRHFDEDEANLLAERVYEALPHDMRGEQDDCGHKCGG